MPPSSSDKNTGPGTDGKPLAGAGSTGTPVEHGQELYLTSLQQQLTGWDNPRAMIEKAIRDGQFLLLAQKIISLRHGAPDPLLYEILLRLTQEEDNLLPPGGFFDLAESVGMMEDIDRWVIGAILGWGAGKLAGKTPAQLPLVCINVSGAALESPAYAQAVADELRQSGYPARALCFEISEIDVVKHQTAARQFVERVKPACRISIDSFGSVKVSFSHLAGLAVDFIKIDGDIVNNIARSATDLARVRAIAAACQKIGVQTIATLVETKETLDKLREIGVDYAQGFGVAPPDALDILG